jgi:predicted Zn-dependent protease
MRARLAIAALIMALAGCEPIVVETARPLPTPPTGAEARAATDDFAEVVARVEPVAERYCRQSRPAGPCNFSIQLADDPKYGPNAFQTLDRSGRPVIVFTVALIANARNPHELAFILGHEAAHHIAGHLERTQGDAFVGAILAGALASAGGAEAAAVAEAQRMGAAVGARSFSKEYELEADALGTRIAAAAGYDPRIGAAYFQRIDDPGNRFLGTHPPNGSRIAVVNATLAEMAAGR